jgi:hypothetical protein
MDSFEYEGLEKVAISGASPPSQYYPNGTAYNSTHVKFFGKQATRLKQQYGYSTYQMLTGKDFIKSLVTETKKHAKWHFVICKRVFGIHRTADCRIAKRKKTFAMGSGH